MRKLILSTVAVSTLLWSCQTTNDSTPTEAGMSGYDIVAQYEKFKEVKMDVDTSFLSSSERAVVNKLIEANAPLNEIYMLQLNAENPAIREAIVNSDISNKDMVLKMFDLHYGPCDALDGNHVFFGETPCPDGGGFYPADMTKEEFENWIAANPEDEKAFRSGYTMIRRDGDSLVAIPYSKAYAPQIAELVRILNEAAELSEEPSLKHFLKLRAKSFTTDDYFESEMAWMDLEGNIDVAIGPYEVYDDQLFGYKTAFEMFLTVKNPEESAALAKYKKYLRDMEANLPVEDSYKNFSRGFESPIIAAYQIQGGGDNVPGIQTIAFNLPNDERVREAKGAKKVILNNVLGAKYDRILGPIGERVLVPEQAALTTKKYMANGTLFHELSHSLGPGSIVVDGRETTVTAELKELYSGIEEGKADIMGIYNILFMMEKAELPAAEKKQMLSTHFTGIFRSVRFGTESAHAKGRTIQYNYYRRTGAVSWDETQQRFQIDYDRMEKAVAELTAMFVRVQGDGNYENARIFLEEYGNLDDEARIVLESLDGIPVDIRPIYPDRI